MALTPTSTTTPYLTAAGLWAYIAPEIVGDALRTSADDPRPSRTALEDTTTADGPGITLNTLLLAACGELESATLVGQRYAVADLAALTGSGQAHRDRIIAGLVALPIYTRLKPGSADPEQIPGYRFAAKQLELLESGERIFGFVEASQSGLPSVNDPDLLSQKYPTSAVTRATRFFGLAKDPRFVGPTTEYP